MSDVGGTNITLAALTPSMGVTGVSVGLSEIVYEFGMRQQFGGTDPWMPFADKWWTGDWLDMTAIEGVVFSSAPAITTGAITVEIDPYGTGNEYVGRITIPIIGDLLSLTEYTWSLSMTISHGTYDTGPLIIEYNTTGQIMGFDGVVADPMTFTTEYVPAAPTKPTNPTPTDAASGIILSTDQVSWDDGGGADTFDVYFGPTGNMTLRSFDQAGTTWDIPLEVLFYETGYEWRIDAANADGVTTGDTWTFDTIVFYPPIPSGEAAGAGGEHGGEGGKNNMVTVKRLVAAANDTIFFEDE